MYIISSDYRYYKKTLPRLLISLLNAGIHREEVAIVVGNSERQEIVNQDGYRFFHETYTAYEHTALVGVIEQSWYDWNNRLFLLHDTCEVGVDFHKRVIQGYEIDADAVTVNWCMCGFGLYRLRYLQSRAEEIVSLKNCSKHEAMVHEGFLARSGTPTVGPYPDRGEPLYITQGISDVYETGTPRLKEYYPQVDLYKYKANYGQTGPHNYIVRP